MFILKAAGGLCWLTCCFTQVLSPLNPYNGGREGKVSITYKATTARLIGNIACISTLSPFNVQTMVSLLAVWNVVFLYYQRSLYTTHKLITSCYKGSFVSPD